VARAGRAVVPSGAHRATHCDRRRQRSRPGSRRSRAAAVARPRQRGLHTTKANFVIAPFQSPQTMSA
jgi:hypothetical protein